MPVFGDVTKEKTFSYLAGQFVEMKHNFIRTALFWIFIILTVYCYGAGMMDYFAIYEPWTLIDAEDFAAFHQYQGIRVINIFVIPSAVMTLFNIASVILPPVYVKRKWLSIRWLPMHSTGSLASACRFPFSWNWKKGRICILLKNY